MICAMFDSFSSVTIFIYRFRTTNRACLILRYKIGIDMNYTIMNARFKSIEIKIILFKKTEKYDKISPSFNIFFLAIKLYQRIFFYLILKLSKIIVIVTRNFDSLCFHKNFLQCFCFTTFYFV